MLIILDGECEKLRLSADLESGILSGQMERLERIKTMYAQIQAELARLWEDCPQIRIIGKK